MPRAVAVVLLVAIIHGASGLLRARASVWHPLPAVIYGLSGELAFWAGAGLSGGALGRRCYGAPAPLGAYFRAFGLASAPGVFIPIGATASVMAPGAERAALPLVALYRVAALFVAVRSAAGLSQAQAAIALGAALLGGLGVVAVVTRLLSTVLPG